MNLFKLSLGLVICGLPFVSVAQNDQDALRYSQNSTFGSARVQSMGGAFGSIGGDLSSMGLNPAGLGVYKKGDLGFSLNVFTNTKGSAEGVDNVNKSGLNVNHAGIIIPLYLNNGKSRVKYLNFGFNYNRTNNFKSTLDYGGYMVKGSNGSSLLDYYTETLNKNGTTETELANNYSLNDARMAYETYLIDHPNGTDSTHYISDFDGSNYGQYYRHRTESKGSQSQSNFSVSTNISDRLFIGMGVNFIGVDYSETMSYRETDTTNTIDYFKSFNLVKSFQTKGSGTNLSLGAIIKPTQWLRFGLAYQSTTALQLTDTYNSSMSSNFDSSIAAGQNKVYYSSEPGEYRYTIYTPSKLTYSFALTNPRLGILSLDIENQDYTQMELVGKDANGEPEASNSFSSINERITKNYSNVTNVRLGAELVLNSFMNKWIDPNNRGAKLLLRSGLVSKQSPYFNNEERTNTFSFGLGYREDSFYWDLSLASTQMAQYNQSFYSLENPNKTIPERIITGKAFYLTTGVGFRF